MVWKDHDPYEDLPEDNQLAFLMLVAEYRNEYELLLDSSADRSWQHQSVYMNKVIAAAQKLKISDVGDHDGINYINDDFSDYFISFSNTLERTLVAIKIEKGRQIRQMSTSIALEDKVKIRAHIDKIRELVENSDAGIDKKEKLYGILNGLTNEIDRDRTRFEYLGDLARGLASLASEIGHDHVLLLWERCQKIGAIIDRSKESEKLLSSPEERKQIEAPRKALFKSKGDTPNQDPDDDIPF